MRNRTGTSAINRRKFVEKAKQAAPVVAATAATAPVIVPASTSVSTAGIAVVAPGAQDRIDGKEPQSTNLFGGEIKVDDEGRMDLSEIEKMDPLTAGARGTVVPTEQFVGMGKDVVYGVDSKNQKHMESGLDLLINPLIKPFMDPKMRSEGVIKDQWYYPEELKMNWNVLPEFMQKGGEGKPPETRSFVEGMSHVVGNIGAIVQSPVAGKIAGDELGVSVERFTRSPSTTAYYLGSALGEIPYFIVGGGTVKAVATISAKATAGVMKGTVKGTAGLALVARTYKIERALEAAAKSTVKSNISAAKTGTITGKKSILKAVEQIKKGYSDNIIKQSDKTHKLQQPQRQIADELVESAKTDSGRLGDRFSASRIDEINNMPTSTKPELVEKVRLAQEFVGEVENILLPQLRTFKTTYLGLTSSMIKGGRIERLANVIQGSPVDVKAKLDRFLNPPGRTQGDIAKTPDLKQGIDGKWYVPEPDSGINVDNVFKQNIHDTVKANWKAGKYEGVLGNIKINKDLFGNVVSSALGINRSRAKAMDYAERFSKAVPVNIIIPGDSAAKAFQQVDDKMTELKIEKTQLEAAKKTALEYADYKTVDTPDGDVFAYASDAMDTNIINNKVKITKLQQSADVLKNEYDTSVSNNKRMIKEQQGIINEKKEKIIPIGSKKTATEIADEKKTKELKLSIKKMKVEITDWTNRLDESSYNVYLKEIKELKSQNTKWIDDSKTKVGFKQQDPNMMSVDDLDKRLAVVDSKINEIPTNLRDKIFTNLGYTRPGLKANRGKDRAWSGATSSGYNPDFDRGTLWRMDVLELNRMFPGFGDMVASQTIHVAVKPAVGIRKEKGLWKGTWGGDSTKLDLTPDQRKTLGLKDGEDRVINDPGGDIWIVNESRKDVLKTMDAKYLPPSKKIKKVGLKKVKLPLVGTVKTLLPWKVDEKVSMVYMLQGTDVLKASAGADPRSGVRPLIQFAAGTSDDVLEPFKTMGYHKVADNLPPIMDVALGDKIKLEYRGLSKADLDKVVGSDAMLKAEKNRKDWQYGLDKAIGQNPEVSDIVKLDKVWQGRDPIELASIQVDGGQGFSKSVPIIDILKQRALLEGNIDSVIGYAKDKDLLFEDKLRYLNYKKKIAEQPMGGWTDTAKVSTPKQKAKIKIDVKKIEGEIKEVKMEKALNLKYTDRKLLNKAEGIHVGGTRQGTVSYMSEYRMNQFASQYDQSATPGNFLRDLKTGESYFISELTPTYTGGGKKITESGVFRILDPENYDSSMTTPGRKVPVDSMSEGGTRMSQIRNELIAVDGAKEPYVQPITGSMMVDTPPGQTPMYRDMPGIAPAYPNQDDMIVWTSSGQITPNVHFKMTPSDRSAFADIMAKSSLDDKLKEGGTLDVKLEIPRTEYEGIDASLTRRMVSLDEPDSWRGILEMVSLDDVGIMKYGKGWKFVKAQQERLANAPDYSGTGSGVLNAIQKQKDNINIDFTKRIGGTLESITEKKTTISEFFTGERFQKIDMRNLNPSQGLGSTEKLDFIEGMLGLGDGVRHAGSDYFALARLQGVSKDMGSIKQGEPVGGFISHPMTEIQDLGYIQKEKVMSDPPRDPTKADKRSNYKILEDAVIRDSGLDIDGNIKPESFMQFKRNMVKLVYKKIKNQEIKSAEVNRIVLDDSRYKATVLDVIDTPGNKKLRYPKTGEKTYNKKEKGFIHPGVDLPPKFRNVIPKPERRGTKTIRQFREQMTPVRPAFGKSFEATTNTFLPGKLPNIINMFLRSKLENRVKQVTLEASSSHYNTALRSVLSELDKMKLLKKKQKKQLDELRSHPNIAWDENMKKLEGWQRTQVEELKIKRDEAQIKLGSVDRNIKNEKSRLDDLVKLKGEKRITMKEAATEFKSYKKQQEQKRIKYTKDVEKYDMQGRELREGYAMVETPYVTAHFTLVSTTEGGVPDFKWLTTGSDPDLIIQPAPHRVGSKGKDINPPPLTYPETRALVEGMVYKSLGITEEKFNRAGGPMIRGINRSIDWELQKGFAKSQAKTNLRSPDDFAKWLKSLDTIGDKNTPKLGDTSRDVVDSLSFKRLTDAKSSATENLQKMEKTKNMEKEKFKQTAPTFSASLMDERITKSLVKGKEVGLMSQLKLGLRSSPAITTATQTEGFGLLPGVDAEPMMVGPEPKNIMEQTISDMQNTMKGIEIGSGKIGDTEGLTVKTYTAPSSLTGISASTGLASMATIDTSSAQVPGFVMDISSGLKLDTKTGQEIIPVFMKFLRTPQEQAQRQVQSFVTPQLYPIKPLLVQATTQVPPITKPPLTNILPIVPVIPKFPAQGRPFKYTRVRKRVRHKKTWWQTPANWYEPYYWGGKNQEGPGYVTFKGREPGKVRKYEKKYFGIGVGDTPFGIKGSWF